MAEKFLLVSLQEEKAKKLANVLSNDTSRKILEFLGEKDANRDEIAKTLNLPMSTVHYNMRNLMENGLIEVKDFFWSDKGKKVNVYGVAKKLIVISQKGAGNVKNKLKELGVLAAVGVAAAGVVKLVSDRLFNQQLARVVEMTADTGSLGAAKSFAAPALESGVAAAGASLQQNLTGTAARQVVEYNIINSQANAAYWFFAGILFILVVYMLWILLKGDRKI